MGQILMSRNPALQQKYYRIGVQAPKSCGTEALKVANLKRLVNEIKRDRDELLKIRSWDTFIDRGLLFATLIRDTCKYSLEVITAVAAMAPGKAGAKFELAGTSAIAMMDLSEAAMQSYISQDMKYVNKAALHTADSYLNTQAAQNSAPFLKSRSFKNTSYTASQSKNINDFRNADNSLRSSQAIRNISYETISYIATESNDPVSKRIKGAVSLVKITDGYAVNIISTLREYRANQTDSKNSRDTIRAAMNSAVSNAEKSLSRAVKELEACLIS